MAQTSQCIHVCTWVACWVANAAAQLQPLARDLPRKINSVCGGSAWHGFVGGSLEKPQQIDPPKEWVEIGHIRWFGAPLSWLRLARAKSVSVVSRRVPGDWSFSSPIGTCREPTRRVLLETAGASPRLGSA